MSKKKKQSNMFNDVMAAVVQQPAAVLSSNENDEICCTDIAVESKLEKNEEIKYDDVCDLKDELNKTINENSMMIDKLASYIDEINQLKHHIDELTAENSMLKKQLNEAVKHASN